MPDMPQDTAPTGATGPAPGSLRAVLPAGEGGPVLRVESLSVGVLGTRPYDILCPTDLVMHRGDVLGLVGESGSGKTTMALALLGYARSGTELHGSVRIDGQEIIAATEAARRRSRGHLVAYVPQDPSTALNPALRIGAQLVEALAPGRRARRDADQSHIGELLDKVHLPATRQFLRRYPHQLSGGQLQRVSIVMAMVNRPRLIVFDEPTTGLDVTTQSHVLHTIRELIRDEQAAAVYVTHDLTVVSSIASRIAVMYSGMLVEQAPSNVALTRSAHPYTRRLVLATPDASRRRALVGISGAPLSPRDRPQGCAFASRCEFVEAACREQVPPPQPVLNDHIVRCHRADFVQRQAGRVTAANASVWQERAVAEEEAVLSARDVNAFYGHAQVLYDVDLAVREGTCLALVGESGSGKTTLARSLSGLHPDALSGTLSFAGQELPWPARKRRPEALKSVQYVFQNPLASLNPRHTIGQIIAQPLINFGLAGSARARRLRIRELLERVSLPAEYEHRYPGQLSGGERQRVAIARGLAAEPRLLICDEVTSSLDVSIQASILELLGRLRVESNLTMVFITHHIGLVRAIADDLVILNRGVVVERGPASQVLDQPTDSYTAELLSNTPHMEALPAQAS
ncbi:MAG TPA: ABC transporter ATP-binding protein [Trebonia sp.]|nr:ABC transporter ATP-binding protein [Trebonia sp.]